MLASPSPRYRAPVDDGRGEEAFRNIQQEARLAEQRIFGADNAKTVAAQQSPRSAHRLVAGSLEHADEVKNVLEHARAWVREAHGTPQLPSVERVLTLIQHSAARAKALASATKRAYEKRFGKFDPRGVTDQNMQRGE